MVVNTQRVKIVLSAFFLVSIIYLGNISFAANEIDPGEGDISVTTIPENPQPYQDVTVTLSSYATDLNKAMIEWQSGASVVLSGYGRTSYSFKTNGPNTATLITVIIAIPGSIDNITKQIIINPSEVELIWEGVDSYTPPFYRGKSFPSAEGLIKVVAIPNTTAIKQGKGSVTYTWKSSGSTVQSSSGYNKDAYVFKNSELNSTENISVTAESVDGQYTATNSIDIPITQPKVVFYKKSPTEGILYNQALTNGTFVSEDEITLVATPYFLALKGNESIFNYTWKINGKEVETPSKKTELTLRPTAHGGYATIGILFDNLNTLYQNITGNLKINL